MNSEKWNEYLTRNTGEYGTFGEGCAERDDNHLGITFFFFKSLNIDNKDKTFLDIGCGNGETNKTEAKWQGLDLVNETENIIKGDAHELPFNDKSFNIIFSSHALEHTLSPIICLLEMKRVLKDDGDLIIGVPLSPGFIYPGHIYVMSLQGWKNLFEQVGFKAKSALEKSNCGAFHLKKE